MFRLTRAQVQPIGVDLGGDSVRMLQLEVVDGGLAVVAAARQAMPDELRDAPLDARLAVAAGMVKAMLRENAFRGRSAVLALPREMVRVKNLRLPATPATDMPAAVAAEAAASFAFEPEATQLRYLPAGEVRQAGEARQEVIAFAAAHDDIDAFVERFHRAGVVVQSLDVQPCAAYRSIERFIRRREDERDVQVLLDIGCEQALVVIGRGRDVTFVKSIDIGGRKLQEAVARKLGLTVPEARALRRRLCETADAPSSPDPVRQAVQDAERTLVEDLAREVGLCLRYYSVTFRGSRPTRMRLIGGEASGGSIAATLGAALPVPVEAGRPLYSVNTSAMKPTDRRGSMAEWAVALGLALRATTQHFGARDGRPRTTDAPPAQPVTVLLEGNAPRPTATPTTINDREPAMDNMPADFSVRPLARGAADA
jgi:type IV pilus assembly protein PilM